MIYPFIFAPLIIFSGAQPVVWLLKFHVIEVKSLKGSVFNLGEEETYGVILLKINNSRYFPKYDLPLRQRILYGKLAS